MKRLFLIRHAKSSWDDAAMPDIDRPLNARGIKDADQMVKRLLQKTSAIDAFISSPAQRAKVTAEKFAAAFGTGKNQVITEPHLYHAPASFYDQFIAEMDDRYNTVAVFSHNPGITGFVNTLTPLLKTDNIPTCGIFAVEAATDSWKIFSAVTKELLFYDYPKLNG